MTRYIYGAGGDAEIVSLTGTPQSNVTGTVYSARTGGAIVTDILSLAGSPLAGQPTSDAYGQFAFQGPDDMTSTLWLDLGGGQPRWAMKPTNTDLIAQEKIRDDVLNAASPTFSGAPNIANFTNAQHDHSSSTKGGSSLKEVTFINDAVGDIPAKVNAITSTTADLFRWQVNSVTKASISTAGLYAGSGATLSPATDIPAFIAKRGTDTSPAADIAKFQTAAGADLARFDSGGVLRGFGVHHLISRQVTTGVTASITFSSIPQTYRHLRLRATCRSTDNNATPVATLYTQMNGITTATYNAAFTQLFNAVDSSNAQEYDTNNTGFHSGFVPNAVNTSFRRSANELILMDYTVTATRRAAMFKGGYVDGDTHFLAEGVTAQDSQAAVTSLVVYLDLGSFTSDCTFELWGEG